MDNLDGIIEVVAVMDDKQALKKLFGELFTEAELRAVGLRWALLKQLAEGIPQREIASNLGISLCKITRGAKLLKDNETEISKIFSYK
jgi:TrpR family transcriptional regulator, trp operon repressor